MTLVVHLMGTVRVERDGQYVDLRGPKQQAVLAVLALSAGRRVSTDRLVDVVWGESPPATARRTVQSYVSSLRRALNGGAALEPSQNGYMLNLDRSSVDLLAFEDRATDLLADAGLDHDDRAQGLADLLSTWETPLDGLRGATRLGELAAPFVELRLQAVEGLAAAQIAGTRAGDAVRMLEALVREHPTRENLWLELARGLNRLGRRDAALNATQRAREALREHLGVDPSALLSALETDLLIDPDSDSDPPPVATGEGQVTEFARFRTVDEVPGNLTAQATSFVGRGDEVSKLAEVVGQNRLVTLTGVGGVGKTRLAIQVAAELIPEFGDGVWLVELAPVGDPGAVPDAVASALGVTARAGRSVTAGIAEALAGRRLLVVLDNCEHVVDAAADLVEAILAVSPTVAIVATSREGLRVDGEHLWPVRSLDVAGGAGSAAVELFTERARAVVPGFTLNDDTRSEAVIEICRRLDGIPLAIELAAARMVSMNVFEVLARLNDRFRLLSGSPRGLERHQTLRQAVQWSYDLLTSDEQTVLGACAVFAAGFDAAAVTAVCERFDEYTMLDLLDSLVRKSLVTVNRTGGRTRHGLLETIRQFAQDQPATGGSGEAAAGGEIADIREVRDRHARYFAAQAVEHWEIWEGPRHDDAADWVEVEFENLRAGFRWAIDRNDLPTATAIAAHTTALGFGLQRFEPVGWAEELLPAAAAAELPHLPRLYTAASSCTYTGRPEDGSRYADAASALQADPRYQPFDIGWTRFMEANAHLYAGRSDRYLEICTALAAQTGLARVVGLCELTFGLPAVGRSDEAIEIADGAVNAARAHANPYWIALAYWGYGRAFAETDPSRSLATFRVGLAYTREHRVPYFEAVIASDSAGLEASHGDLDQALNLFSVSLDSFHQAGNTASLALTFARLAVFFIRASQPEVAATIYGATTHHPTVKQVAGFAAAVDQVHRTLEAQTLDDCVRAGAAMTLTETVHYAHHHINTSRTRHVWSGPSSSSR